MRRHLLAFTLVGCTLLLAVLIFTDALPALRGPAPETSEWHWLYELRPQSRWWLPFLAATGIWLFGFWWLRQERPFRGIGLAGLVTGSLLLQLALVYAHRPQVAAELVDRTLSNETNGYFTVAAATTDINTLLRDFPQIMPTLSSEHTRTHPPGLILAQWLTIRVSAAATPLAETVYPLRCTDLWLLNQPPATVVALAIWAFLPLVAAALTVVPVYFLGYQLYHDRVARLSALLTATLPALLIFAPTPDQLFALLAAIILLIWVVAVQRRHAPYAFLAGLLLSLTTFFSLGNGALALVLGVFAFVQPNRQSSIVNLKWLFWFVFGLASLWLIYWLGWGVPPWAVARVGLQQHYELVTRLRRYDWWVLYNLLDLLIFAGPVVVLGFAAANLTTIRHLFARTRRVHDGLILALALLILALDLSGSARGEVGRLWLFFMPLLAVVSASQHFSESAFQRVSTSARQPSTLSPQPSALSTQYSTLSPHSPLLLFAQLILVLSLGLAWKPIEAIIVVAQRPEMPATTPTHELSVTFGETIQLTGYDLDLEQVRAGGTLAVTLYWQAEGAAARPYTVFTHILNQDGTLITQKDNWPVNGLWPPTCWKTGEIVVDSYSVPLPADLPSGTYSILVGLYDADTSTRLLTPAGQDAFLLRNDVVIGQ